MPYVVRKEGQSYTVRKRYTGKLIGRTTSRQKAQAMIAAIHASENRRKRA